MKLQREDIRTKDVLRYLGYNQQELSPQLAEDIESAITAVLAVAKPRFVSHQYPLHFNEDTKEVAAVGTSLVFTGESVWEHLSEAHEVVLFTATLGTEVERELQRIRLFDLTKYVLMDASATAAIEAVCDKVEKELKEPLSTQNLYTNYRFSPGYGDLPIAVQQDLLQVLQAYKQIGVSCTSEFLMIPQKSVSAFFGVFSKPFTQQEKDTCKNCNQRSNCSFRERGEECCIF